MAAPTLAQDADDAGPTAGVDINQEGASDLELRVEGPLQIMLLLTMITFIPSIVIMMTCFTRIVVVLGFVRTALGTQQIPPPQVLVGLALFLTFFVMRPTLVDLNEQAIQPFIAGEVEMPEAAQRAVGPLRMFMASNTRTEDLVLFLEMSERGRPETLADVPTHVLVPAFVISELRRAFEIGFILYVPFLIIDMVIASTLLSMGMMMLPPMMLSVPFKLLLFVLVDGWNVLTQNLVASFAPI
ncbi:MAG: flagellar type III secretion system pore protein FliP [Armatimonadia bacterium]|nr:flagellar type III secretion system pore protein FliP [Armatimonadia bacterium]